MQITLLYILSAVAVVAAIPARAPASLTLSQPQDVAGQVDVIAPAIADLHIGTTSSPNMKTINVIKINMDQCSACLGAVGQTIGSCQPVLSGWSGWFHIPGCIKSIVRDFKVLKDDCIPCLKSL